MRLLLILIFVTYASARFGRSHRSRDTEVLPVPLKNVSTFTVDTIVVSLSPATATTTTTAKQVENVPKPVTTAGSPSDHEKDVKQPDDLKIRTLKETTNHYHEENIKSTEHDDKLKKIESKAGTELLDVSEELTYDEIEERVEKELADQYKDEDDYGSAEQQTTSLLTTQESTSSSVAVTTYVTGSSASAITTSTASPSTVATAASTSKVIEKSTVATSGAKLRTTAAKVSRRNNGAVQISISVGSVDDSYPGTDATLGKIDIGRRKNTRFPKTSAQKMFAAVEPKNDASSSNKQAQPQKLCGVKNISDPQRSDLSVYQPKRIYETTTKRVIEILRTMKYKKNSSPRTINNLEEKTEKAMVLFLSFSILAYSA